MTKLMIIFIMIFSINLFAASVNNTYCNSDRLIDMQNMAQGMSLIQSGFFYNNDKTVLKGSDILRTALKNIKTTSEDQNNTELIDKYICQKYQLRNKTIRKINKKLKNLTERFLEGDFLYADQAYNKIKDQCNKCHREVRLYKKGV